MRRNGVKDGGNGEKSGEMMRDSKGEMVRNGVKEGGSGEK